MNSDPITGLYAPKALPANTGARWSPTLPTRHGEERVYPGRRVLVVPGRTWASTPATCSAPMHGIAVDDIDPGLVICPECGIDVT